MTQFSNPKILQELLWLRGRSGLPILTVLTYHRVGDETDVGEFDPDVREVDAKGLSEHINLLRCVGTIVSLDEVRSFFQGKPLPPNPVMLAFDDGYVDCRDVIFPILQKEGVSGTFFIPTSFPDAGQLFWWDRLHLLLLRRRSGQIILRYPSAIELDIDANFDHAKRILLRLIKRTANLDLSKFFDTLENALGYCLGRDEERKLSEKNILGFRDIRALKDSGMAVASHSHTHRVLETLSPVEVFSDLRMSRRILREALDVDVTTVAYPVGHRLSGGFRRAVDLAGFDLAFTNATGLCFLRGADPLNVQRIAVGRDESKDVRLWRLFWG